MVSSPLRRYFEENFFIIPIRKNDKRPLFKGWNNYPLSYMETRQYIKEGYNIAVVAKELWILDFDKRLEANGERINDNIESYRDYGTLIQFSPHGFHIFLRCNDPLNEFIVTKFADPKPDTIRHGDMYVLIAPSKIDGKSYWWLDNMKGEILTL